MGKITLFHAYDFCRIFKIRSKSTLCSRVLRQCDGRRWHHVPQRSKQTVVPRQFKSKPLIGQQARTVLRIGSLPLSLSLYPLCPRPFPAAAPICTSSNSTRSSDLSDQSHSTVWNQTDRFRTSERMLHRSPGLGDETHRRRFG